ncbi:MAG: small multi-drug export protein [Lachnospiraceae bacterium]|nr:small multi-drug export protein [Lachnospiraceae bacterium]
MDAIATWFANTLGQYIPAEAVTFLVSLMPFLECRGGIVVGRLLGMTLGSTIFFSVIGNILPIPFILLFIKKIFSWLRPTKLMGPVVKKLEAKAMNKSSALDKGEFIGLLLFVGIPLPGTGAWTGSLIASLLGIDIKKASVAILIGIAMATTIVSLIMYGIL